MPNETKFKISVETLIKNAALTMDGGRQVTKYPYIEAMRRLSNDTTLSVADRYQVGRTVKQLVAITDDLELKRNQLIEKLGTKTSVTLERRRAALKASIESAGDKKNSGHLLQEKELSQVEHQISQIAKAPMMMDNFVIPPDDAEAIAKFTDEIKEEMKTVIEFAHLNHVILLKPQSAFGGEDMGILDGIVEPAPE